MEGNFLENWLNSISIKNISKDLRLNLNLPAIIFICFSSCIEHFEFKSQSESPAVIVDGFISDISSDDHTGLFGEPRLFFVKLKYTGAVKNFLDEGISRAEVELISDQNEHWDYTEDVDQPGVYYLYYSAFKSEKNVKYKVSVKLENGEAYESEFDQMPSEDVRGVINSEETEKFEKIVASGEHVIKGFDGLDINIQMPASSDEEFSYYRWDFNITWIVVAEFLPRIGPRECWVSEKYYFNKNVIERQKGPPPNTNLLFLKTTGNQQTKFGFSVVIRQEGISKEYHQFWTDLHNQKSQSELFAPPPYNIFSNINSVGHDKEAYGFFGVVNEEYYIWYFDKRALSYVPLYIEECFVPPNFDPAEWCANCMAYGGIKKGDQITNIKPIWWTF